MITHKIHKLPKNTVEIIVEIPWNEIEKEYGTAFDVIHKEFVFEGYRRGKVPKELAEKHISRDSVYQQLIHTLLPRIYDDIVKKEELKPIISPKVDLISAKEKEDWQVKITFAEKPTIELGDFKKYIIEAKGEIKKDEIWVPGKEPKKEESKDEKYQKNINIVLKALLDHAKAEIPDIILEEEVNQKLTKLLDDIQKIGLTVDGYLKSKNLTIEDLKAQISKETVETYKLEFILMEVADQAQIKIEQSDLDALFTSIKSDKDRQAAQENAYFYASILRKQKTLDYLTSL